jgi:hypothetical protein
MKPDVILEHLGGHWIVAFDFLSKTRKRVSLKDYDMPDCKYVLQFQEKHPEYRYLGSTDLGHIEPANAAISQGLAAMVKRGWQIVIMPEAQK